MTANDIARAPGRCAWQFGRRPRRRTFGAAAFVFMMALFISTDARGQGAASCTVTTTPLAFGSYDVFNPSAADSTGSVTFRCNAQAANISVALNAGQSGTFSPRKLTQGSESLGYNLYRDAARTAIWGDGSGGTQTYTNANPPNNQNVTLTIYGRIPAAQDVSAGVYNDTVVATVNF